MKAPSVKDRLGADGWLKNILVCYLVKLGVNIDIYKRSRQLFEDFFT